MYQLLKVIQLLILCLFVFLKVCLQFPDDLIPFSVTILEDLKKNTSAQLCILGDTSYGSCCVDEVQ